jgi:hypothetical protein
MKNKPKELDVDFIGGQQKPVTREEELAISAFIHASKEKNSALSVRAAKTKRTKKTHQPA